MIPANVLTLYRNAIKKILEGNAEARELESAMASQGGPAMLFSEGDFVGANADIDEGQLIGAVISRGEIETLLTANGNAHLTNLNKMRYGG